MGRRSTRLGYFAYILVEDQVYPKPGFWGFGSAVEKWVLDKLNNDFLQFLPYLMICQSAACRRRCKTLKNPQIMAKIFGKKM